MGTVRSDTHFQQNNYEGFRERKAIGDISKDDPKEENSSTVVRKSWKYEVYGFLFGLLSSLLLAFSAACVRAMKQAIPDIEVM